MSVLTSILWMALLLQTRDTVVSIPMPVAQSWTTSVVSVSQLIVSIAVLGLLVAVILALLALRKSLFELTKLFHSSYGDISAAAHSVRNMSDDVRAITSSVRGEVEGVGDTVHALNEGVRNAMQRAEDRLERLDALVGVAQDEAEDFIVSSASTLRGFRFGAGMLRRSFGFARRNGGARRFRKRRLRDERKASRREDAGEERPRIRRKVPDEQ